MTPAAPPRTRRVLALGAHPDDVEFLCAGTLVLMHELGWKVHVATMSPGDLGSATLDREATALLRREEARRSAAMLKGSYSCLEARDFQIFFGDALLRRATGLVRSVDPDVVLTHSPVDYLADHEETARIARHACFAAPVALYRTDGDEPPTPRIPHLYYADPIELIDPFGAPVRPDFVVDVGSAMAMKELMLGCHSSQREWMRRQHGEDDYVATMKRWCAQRGAEAGLAFAEGFRQHRGHAFPRTPLLQDELGTRARAPG
jgi:LmbE family N-acetylglucosaminyl deacetylase